MAEQLTSDIFAAMQTGAPYKSYIKTVLGKVYVMVLNPFDETPEGVFLKGNPKKEKERKGCIVHVWDAKGDAFFKNINERQFIMKHITEYTPPVTAPKVEPVAVEKPMEEWTDEELLLGVLNLKYAAFTPIVNKITNPVNLFRLIELAQTNEKSPKYIRDLKAKLAEVQANEFSEEEE
jgi:hypothetical protein